MSRPSGSDAVIALCYHSDVAQILVRNIDDDTVDALKARAAREGKALEQLVREVLAAFAHSEKDRLLAYTDALQARSPDYLIDPTELIREDRDYGHGGL
jgi:antitoxin FitA